MIKLFWLRDNLQRWGLVGIGLLILVAIAMALIYSENFGIFLTATCALLVLCGLIAYRIVKLWKEGQRGLSGSQFRFKVVGLFSALVVGPCIIVAIFAILFLEVGVQTWFHQRVQTAVQESQNVAESYLIEHQKVISHTIGVMAQGLNAFFDTLAQGKQLAESNPQEFFLQHQQDLSEYLTFHEAFRSVREAMIFRIDPKIQRFSKASVRIPLTVVAHSRFSLSLGFKTLALGNIQKADKDGMFLSLNDQGDQVFAIVPIFFPLNAYLLVSRDVDKGVLQKIKRATDAVHAYDNLLEKQGEFALQFVIIFGIFTLLLLLLAIWGGLVFARQFMTPIEQLIDAAQSIRKGFLKTVPDRQESHIEELTALTSTFNAMVMEMTHQKENLIHVNQCLEARTHFIENVMSGISSGVISLDKDGVITLSNHRAQRLLGQKISLENKRLDAIVPEFKDILEAAHHQNGILTEGQFTMYRAGRPATFHVHALAEEQEMVLTFDDITELISAQKKAAWSDVARRIAHEVKNPLTPIVLSAERLKRRYLPNIQPEDIFRDCIETIIRQVGHIGKLISEFSSFARLPTPVFRPVALDYLIQQEVALQEQAYPDIAFLKELKPLLVICDGQQMAQVLNNLLKNAVDAIHEKAHVAGQICVRLYAQQQRVFLEVEDNGVGVSSEILLSLGEPYMTTKSHGTGLGLAIVKKIIEDHGGEFSLQVSDTGGTLARVMIFQQKEDTL